MKKLFLTLLIATLCATGYGQTIKALGYNTTNGKIGYAGTNPLTFTNTVFFGDDVSINPSAGINYGGSEVMNLEERTLVGDWAVAGGLGFFNATNAATTRTNLGLGATWLTNDNVTNFRTAIGLGATNEVTFQNVNIEAGALYIRQSTNEYFYAGDDLVESYVPVTIFHPNGLEFGGTNAATAAASTRTNLGLPLPALTNTNVGNFRAAIGLDGTNASPVKYASVLFDSARAEDGLEIDDGAWRVSTQSTLADAPTNTTNAVLWIEVTDDTNSYRLPLYQ
jgi:hypothetical protein